MRILFICMLLFTFIKHSNSSDYELMKKARTALHRGDCNTAIDLYGEGAKKGLTEAEHQIGYMYYYGKCLKKDINKAVKWYQLGVKKNNPASLLAMGNKYRLGQVVQKDLRKAVELYQKAADLNFPKAQFNLGLMYFDGMGTAKNIELAHKWITKAANQGYKNASDFLNKYQSKFSAFNSQKSYAQNTKKRKYYDPKTYRESQKTTQRHTNQNLTRLADYIGFLTQCYEIREGYQSVYITVGELKRAKRKANYIIQKSSLPGNKNELINKFYNIMVPEQIEKFNQSMGALMFMNSNWNPKLRQECQNMGFVVKMSKSLSDFKSNN